MTRGRHLAHWIGRVGPPIGLMGLIYYLSAQPNLGTDLGWIDVVGRKLVHMFEYGLLWLLWYRALGWDARAGWLAAAIAIGYAGTDEFHQTFVSGRSGATRDVAIDGAGVAVAAALTHAVRSRRRRHSAGRRA